MQCKFCEDGSQGTMAMPQSSDQGQTIERVVCCDGHVDGWWDGSDWDGQALAIPLSNEPNAVTFHDRGLGRETRLISDGKIIPRTESGNEMLYPELFADVENQIAGGTYSGYTKDPCYPEFTLRYISQ